MPTLAPPRFVRRPAFTVVGMEIIATPFSPVIPQLWQQFGPRMGEVTSLAEPGAAYGVIGTMDPATEQFPYVAGVAVTEASSLPMGMKALTLPPAEYAVFGSTLPTIRQVFQDIYGTWLPTSGRHAAVSPSFEHYGPAFNPQDPASPFDIYVAVVPLE